MAKLKNKISKRLFDIFFSLLGLILISPFLIIVSIIIKITSEGPVFFLQERLGQYEKPFFIYKFRTMLINAESLGKQITVKGDNRITKVGKVLRRYKIDEFPQLINVLLGEMSFVGPRPEVKKYVDLYTNDQKEIFKVKPGITDYASLEYRNENDLLSTVEDPEAYYINTIMQDKIKLNKKYIEKNNLFIDVKIILNTISKCFR